MSSFVVKLSNTPEKRFIHFHQAMDYIREKVAHWNNFNPGKKLVIVVEKGSEIMASETLGVEVSDGIEAEDIFGRK